MRYTLVMTRVKIEYMLFAAMSLVAGAAYGRGPVVAAVGSGPWANPDLYVGEWYEIARFDHPFQEGTVGSRVVYRLLSESKMRIVYRGKDGRTGRDRISSAKGRLSADYECLRVSSCWFFYSDLYDVGMRFRCRAAVGRRKRPIGQIFMDSRSPTSIIYAGAGPDSGPGRKTGIRYR